MFLHYFVYIKWTSNIRSLILLMANHRHSIKAIIYDKRGRVLSIGENSYVKSHPVQKKYAVKAQEPHKIFLHAEIHAILKVPDISKAHKISIFRFGEGGKPRLAAPCKICESAIAATPIKVVEYTVQSDDVFDLSK